MINLPELDNVCPAVASNCDEHSGEL